MAGAAIKTNAREVGDEIKVIARRCGSTEPALQIIGAHMVDSTIQNFEAGGRPQKWQELSPVTLARKKGGSILIGKGMAGGLMGSIHFEVEPNIVYWGTNKIYGAIQNFGGHAGRVHKVTIPAREYLLVLDEDWKEIGQELGDFILEKTT